MHTRRAVGTVSRASIWQVTAKTLFAYMHDAKACSVFDIIHNTDAESSETVTMVDCR